jgi:hypothetical protein
MADFAAAAAPDDNHTKLQPFVGTFKSVVKIWMGPGEPMVSTGTMVNEWDLGGRFIKQTYTGDPSPGPFGSFEGRGFWGYNKSRSQYEGLWIDTCTTQMQNETGQVDKTGKVWTMLGHITCDQSKQPYTKRSVITVKDNNGHSMVMYSKGPDGKEEKNMEIQYTRVK